MTRQLRPRKTRPSYAKLAGLYSDDESDSMELGPSSSKMVVDEEDGSESDFAPEKGIQSLPDEQEEISDTDVASDNDEDEDGEGDEEQTPIATTYTTQKPGSLNKGKGKAKAKAKAATSPVKSTASGVKTAFRSKRKSYSLPTPNVHLRHRAVPLFSRPEQSERLAEYPNIFQPTHTVLTNSFTGNGKVMDRVNKTWGFNIGPGPSWEVVEDRGWYKEAETKGEDHETERKRRPRVHQDFALRDAWEVLSSEAAAAYLPTANTATDDGQLQPPPPISCYFGSINSQTLQHVSMFETFPMSKYASNSNAHVFNAGAPVWCLDWCPIHPDDRPRRHFKQYLAVAPLPSNSHSPDIGRKVARPSYACIQIWSLSSSQNSAETRKHTKRNLDRSQMNCDLVLCLDIGPAFSLKWCPLPSHDVVGAERKHRKLGLLGVVSEDGAFAVYAVPDPEDVPLGHDQLHPTYLKLTRPVLRIELEETSCWSFDWGNSSLIAIGTTNGTIAVYDIGQVLKEASNTDYPTVTDIIPTHYLSVHQSAIRTLAWIKVPPAAPSGKPRTDQDPTVITSGGYDGMECMTDIREGRSAAINRTRDVINTMAFSPYAGGPITLDHENTVKAYSASPSMLGRGHTLFEPQGPVWSVHASDYHPQIVVGAADGTCSTTNTLRSTRKGGAVPFFVYKIFQMDYNRSTEEYRMLDRFLPQESIDRPAAIRTARGRARAGVSPNHDRKGNASGTSPVVVPSTGAWPQQIGVHCVTWNNGNGLATSGLVAAATASGLCRVDLVWGEWAKGKIPYGGIEGIRMEGLVDTDSDPMDVDDDGEQNLEEDSDE